MTLRWRNGVFHVGHDYLRDGFSIALLWGRRSSMVWLLTLQFAPSPSPTGR